MASVLWRKWDSIDYRLKRYTEKQFRDCARDVMEIDIKTYGVSGIVVCE